MSLDFWLGTHRAYWLAQTSVPLFIARQQLAAYKGELPHALGSWALDSGGFTEIERHGRWTVLPEDYVSFVRRCASEVGRLAWVAPQDWMCEPKMLEKTGLTVAEHQTRTVRNFAELRSELGPLVVPVLQGWTLDEYLACSDLYERSGFDLTEEPLVGIGSVCRRQSTRQAAVIIRGLASTGIRLHGFGIKLGGLSGRFAYWDALASCDSLAWSAAARMDAWKGRPSCEPSKRKACNNCLHYALSWRETLASLLDPDQQPLWKEAV